MENRPLVHPIVAQSLVETITRQLETAIVSGQIPPGAKLSELALSKQLGVSRSPLREAMRRLEGRKLIERTPNKGARVAELSDRELHDLLVVREALEGIACRYAAQRMSDSEIAGLRQLLKEHGTQEPVRQGTGYYQEGKDFDFHFKIVKGSRNERLTEMLCGDLYDLLRVYRYRSSTQEGRARKAFEEHVAIVEAIASRDPNRAEMAMRQHTRNARLDIEARLKAATTEPDLKLAHSTSEDAGPAPMQPTTAAPVPKRSKTARTKRSHLGLV